MCYIYNSIEPLIFTGEALRQETLIYDKDLVFPKTPPADFGGHDAIRFAHRADPVLAMR